MNQLENSLLSPVQREALIEFDKGTKVSNLRQALIGKRIPFSDKNFSVVTCLQKVEDFIFQSGTTETVELVVSSRVNCSGKEPLLLKTIKDPWN
jgi:hypothetical protein